MRQLPSRFKDTVMSDQTSEHLNVYKSRQPSDIPKTPYELVRKRFKGSTRPKTSIRMRPDDSVDLLLENSSSAIAREESLPTRLTHY